MKKIVIPNGVEAVVAEYNEQIIDEYSGNPLIECLPRLTDKYDAIEMLAVYPPYSLKEKDLEAYYRIHMVQRLYQYFQPLSVHLDLYNRINLMIRQGYLYRNPLSKEMAINFNNGYQAILKSNIELNSSDIFGASSVGFSIVGVSGMGKTTSIDRVLSTIPQVVVHSKYKDKKLSMYQINYIKLECPYDASVKALCINFFGKVDGILGTNYMKKYGTGRLSANAMIPIMAQVARNISLGCLIIDEIQLLSSRSSGGGEKLLNFILSLNNTIGVPLLLIGTPSAMSILQSQFRLARRNSCQGAMIWDRLKNDDNWDLLIEGLWEYQWTKIYTPISKEYIDIMYQLSQGIIDIAKKIFIMVQIKIIADGTERITTDAIKKVHEENFKLVKPMVDALRTGNLNKIAKYEDIYFSENVDKYIQAQSSKIELNKKIRELQNIRKEEDELKDKSLIDTIITKLIDIGVEEEGLLDKVQLKIEKYNKILDSKQKIKIIIKDILVSSEKEIRKKSSILNKYNEDDLRFIYEETKKEQVDIYSKLKELGYIKKYNYFVGEVVI